MSSPSQRSSSRVSLASLTPNNLGIAAFSLSATCADIVPGTVRKLNSVLFPIKYSEKFYQDVLLPEAEEFCKLSASRSLSAGPSVDHACPVYYNDIPVGTICCRLETVDGKTRLYLMTMGVLAVSGTRPCHPIVSLNLVHPRKPYRSRGLGSHALQHVLKAAEASVKPKIKDIYLHVQVSNDAAKKFYERHGFKETSVFEGYYKKIVPHDAWVLEKEIEASTAAS